MNDSIIYFQKVTCLWITTTLL